MFIMLANGLGSLQANNVDEFYLKVLNQLQLIQDTVVVEG